MTKPAIESIKVRLNDISMELTIEDAKELHRQLDGLLGMRYFRTPYPCPVYQRPVFIPHWQDGTTAGDIPIETTITNAIGDAAYIESNSGKWMA